MSIEQILSDRLIFIPFTLDIATSVFEGNLDVLESLGLKRDKDWPDVESIETLPKIIKNLKLVIEPSGFESWMIVKKDNMIVIGDAGFKGKPDANGEVDIGYSIIEKEQKKGYGFETVKKLADWAFSQREVHFITASCLINNITSARILEKIGMQEISRDKEMIYWRISKNHYQDLA
ncbi:MAG: GNAT family N-acetyltransferase [Ruminiclostridium sp.]